MVLWQVQGPCDGLEKNGNLQMPRLLGYPLEAIRGTEECHVWHAENQRFHQFPSDWT